MKATGIVRRIDELGRVVIPKEIRRTQRIRQGDALEIFTAADGQVVFKKYSPLVELGELAGVYAEVLAKNNGNIIKLEHNQFVNINRQNGVELKVTLEAFGQDHKRQILDELRQNGYSVQEVMTADFYH